MAREATIARESNARPLNAVSNVGRRTRSYAMNGSNDELRRAIDIREYEMENAAVRRGTAGRTSYDLENDIRRINRAARNMRRRLG